MVLGSATESPADPHRGLHRGITRPCCHHCLRGSIPCEQLPLRAAVHAMVPFVTLLPVRSVNEAVEVLTQLEVSRTLQLCGVKRHRCREAAWQLWEDLLTHCYTTHTTGTTSSSDTGASIVRYAALRDKRELVPVPLEEVLAATVSLQRGGSGSGFSGEEANILTDAAAPSPCDGDMDKGSYVLAIACGAFERCIAKLLSRELRGQRITLCPLQRWTTAQAIVQHRRPLVVFCGGTSGCGKTTLASLVANHLSSGTVLSTDTIREGLRKSLCREEFPELYVSTYEAYRCAGMKDIMNDNDSSNNDTNCSTSGIQEVDPQAVTAAYEKQCEFVLRVLDRMLERLVARSQAVVVEGVHLLVSYMKRKSTELRAQGVMCLPFLVSITKERRHMERFCTRAKFLNILPERNKYIAHFRSIRQIQEHLLDQARQLGVKIVNNTNVDNSLMMVHGHLLDCIDREGEGATPNCCSTNVDQNINGKRMLALLLHRRREKARRVAGTNTDKDDNHNSNNTNNSYTYTNAAEGGGGMCECCVALSLCRQATRSRSAESLTSFQLRALSTCAYEDPISRGCRRRLPTPARLRGAAKCAAGRTSPDSASWETITNAEARGRGDLGGGVTDDECMSRTESPYIQQQQQQQWAAGQRGTVRCASADVQRGYAGARVASGGIGSKADEEKSRVGRLGRWDIPSLMGS